MIDLDDTIETLRYRLVISQEPADAVASAARLINEIGRWLDELIDELAT